MLCRKVAPGRYGRQLSEGCGEDAESGAADGQRMDSAAPSLQSSLGDVEKYRKMTVEHSHWIGDLKRSKMTSEKAV